MCSSVSNLESRLPIRGGQALRRSLLRVRPRPKNQRLRPATRIPVVITGYGRPARDISSAEKRGRLVRRESVGGRLPTATKVILSLGRRPQRFPSSLRTGGNYRGAGNWRAYKLSSRRSTFVRV